MGIKTRLFRFLIGLDQAFNPLILGGSEDVTISSETAYRELIRKSKMARVGRHIIDWVFRTLFGQQKHCYESLWGEIRQFPDEEETIRAALLAVPGFADIVGVD